MQRVIFSIILMLAFRNGAWAALENIKVGSTTRTMIAYAPSGIPQNRPLIISMHGSNQDAPYQQGKALWEPIADTANFVIVYPNGVNKQWDISGTSDINYILTIIDTMYSRYKIDKNRVYVSGFSMGGMMSYFVATKIADKVAAIAPVSGYLFSGVATSTRPMPIIHIHGTTDDVVGFSGVEPYLSKWRTRNKCPSTSTTIKPYPSSKPGSVAIWQFWGPCENSEVALISLTGKGHWYSTDAASIHSSVEIWNFVKKFSLNGTTPTSSAIANSSSSITTSSSSVVTVAQAAFSSMATIPGTIQAENYDIGGEGVSFHDADATNSGAIYRTDGVDITGDATLGYQVGWTVAGEWLEYTVNVKTPGAYKWEAKVSAGGDGSAFHVLLDNVEATGPVTIDNTGNWNNYTTLSGTTPVLTAGQKVMRVEVDGSYFNLDWISFSEIPVSPKISNQSLASKKHGVYSIYNLKGVLIGMVHLNRGEDIRATVGKISREPGVYLAKEKENGKSFLVHPIR